MTRKENVIQFIKFTALSISAGVIQIVSELLLYNVIHAPSWAAYLVSLVLSVLWNFTLNKRFTFKSAANVPKAMLLVFAFYLVFTPFTVLDQYLFVDVLGAPNVLITLANMLLNFVGEYFYCRLVVYRGSMNTLK